MPRFASPSLALACLLLAASPARADTLVEDFSAAFPAWQSGWLGTHSDARNYCETNWCWVGSDWAMGPTVQGEPGTSGMWLGNTTNNPFTPDQVTFDPAFGGALTSLRIDVASYVDSTLQAWDAHGQLIFSQTLAVHDYHDNPPTAYQSFEILSSTGISSFALSGMTMGNVMIDNLVAVTAVPEPAGAAMLLAGLGLLALGRGRRPLPVSRLPASWKRIG